MSERARQDVSRARAVFEDVFGAGETVAAWAPGRVNLIGEHTDYNGGVSLPIAINLGCAAVGRAGAATCDRVVAADLDERWEGGPAPAWARYIEGVLTLMRARLGDPGPLDLVVTSSVPRGAGLSSSAALEVSIATLFEALAGETMPPLEKARLCQHAEHEFAGVPCGLMDQLVGACARAGDAMLIDFSDDSWTFAPAPPCGALMVVDSGVRHALADGEYAKRRATCERACGVLGVGALGELSAPAWEDGRLDEPMRRCVRHVVTEIARTREAAAALAAGNLAAVGGLMCSSHRSLKDDYRVSCAEVDAIVESMSGVDGVHGARMTGGGFGGSVIVLGEAGAMARLARDSDGAKRARFLVDAGAGAMVVE